MKTLTTCNAHVQHSFYVEHIPLPVLPMREVLCPKSSVMHGVSRPDGPQRRGLHPVPRARPRGSCTATSEGRPGLLPL